MRKTSIKKMLKSNPEELLFWVASCSLPKVNSERRAIIEYLLGVVATAKYVESSCKSISRKVVEELFRDAFKDLEEYVAAFKDDIFRYSFSLGYLTIRGEAFPWQLARTAIERYAPHDEWMSQKLGFTINDAVEFTKTIMKEVLLKSTNSVPPSFPHYTEEQYYDPRYIFIPDKGTAIFWETSSVFSTDFLRSKIPIHKHSQFKRYLERLSIDFDKRPEPLSSIGDYNPITGRPLIKMENNYFLPIPSLLWRALPSTFHYDLLSDDSYRGKYISTKGAVAERRARDCLAKMFCEDNIHTRVRYEKKKGWPDIDILVDDELVTVLVECTSKWMTQGSKKGYLESIINDLQQSVVKCIRQLARAQTALSNRQLQTKSSGKILPIIVVDDFIPNLESVLHYSNLVEETRPYIISTYDLDIITDLIPKNDFINFVAQRIEVSRKGVMFCTDELDYLVFYLSHGFEEYVDKLKEHGSELLYIGHLKNLFPTYYGQKLREFLNDAQLEAMFESEKSELMEGWS